MNAAPMVNECLRRQMLHEIDALPNHGCGSRADENVRATGLEMSKSDYGYVDARAISAEESSREAIGLGLTP